MRTRLVLGAVLLLVRPVYIGVELVVASAATGGYSLTQDTVSELGTVGCASQPCSPEHALMNVTFVLVGLALVVGALLLRPCFGSLVTALLVVAGLSTVATGLVPVDGNGMLHAVAAAPLFVCQPWALLLLGRRPGPRGVRVVLVVTAAAASAAAVAFVALDAWSGLYERVALWPVLFAIALVALVGTRRYGASGGTAGAGGRFPARGRTRAHRR